MSRNYDVGTRDMSQAGRALLSSATARGDCSFATVDAVGDRWSKFVVYAKFQGVGRMERVSRELVCDYGKLLAQRVAEGDMSPAYAQNLVAAVNSIMHLVRRWHSVSPTRDCGIASRSSVRKKVPGSLDIAVFESAMRELHNKTLIRQAAVAGLARRFGLRSKEASLLDASTALRQATTLARIEVVDGTKGGRARAVPVISAEQIRVLDAAVCVQGHGRSMVSSMETWIQWRNRGLREGREILKQCGVDGYHDLRAAYACDRYEALTGHLAPVRGENVVRNKQQDLEARLVISRELGHERIDVVAAYIGAR